MKEKVSQGIRYGTAVCLGAFLTFLAIAFVYLPDHPQEHFRLTYIQQYDGLQLEVQEDAHRIVTHMLVFQDKRLLMQVLPPAQGHQHARHYCGQGHVMPIVFDEVNHDEHTLCLDCKIQFHVTQEMRTYKNEPFNTCESRTIAQRM